MYLIHMLIPWAETSLKSVVTLQCSGCWTIVQIRLLEMGNSLILFVTHPLTCVVFAGVTGTCSQTSALCARVSTQSVGPCVQLGFKQEPSTRLFQALLRQWQTNKISACGCPLTSVPCCYLKFPWWPQVIHEVRSLCMLETLKYVVFQEAAWRGTSDMLRSCMVTYIES